MTASRTLTFAALLSSRRPGCLRAAPPRPAETPRGVTLTLAEYNRLIDLSTGAPQPPARPLPRRCSRPRT